jgi:hypothetical protein
MVYFSRFGILCQEKSGSPAQEAVQMKQCDQTLCEKIAQLCQNIAKKINKNFNPKKLLLKTWEIPNVFLHLKLIY